MRSRCGEVHGRCAHGRCAHGRCAHDVPYAEPSRMEDGDTRKGLVGVGAVLTAAAACCTACVGTDVHRQCERCCARARSCTTRPKLHAPLPPPPLCVPGPPPPPLPPSDARLDARWPDVVPYGIDQDLGVGGDGSTYRSARRASQRPPAPAQGHGASVERHVCIHVALARSPHDVRVVTQAL